MSTYPTKKHFAEHGEILWNALRQIFNLPQSSIGKAFCISDSALNEFRIKGLFYNVVYPENRINNDLLRKKWMDDIETGITAKGKVYCSDCKFFLTKKPKYSKRIGLEQPPTISCVECSYPDNVCKWLEDSFAEPNYFRRGPKEINSDNNCKWFESK